MLEWGRGTWLPDAKPLPEMKKAEEGGAYVEIRISLTKLVDPELGLVAKIRNPADDIHPFPRETGGGKGIANIGEDRGKERKTRRSGLRSSDGARVAPPYAANGRNHLAQLPRRMTSVGENLAPLQQSMVIPSEPVLSVLGQQPVLTPVRHGEEGLLPGCQGCDELGPGGRLHEKGMRSLGQEAQRNGKVRLRRGVITWYEEDQWGTGRWAVRRRKSREIRSRSDEYCRPTSSPSSMWRASSFAV